MGITHSKKVDTNRPQTATFLRNLKATDKVQKHATGGGLYLHVSTTGGKLWRMAYRLEGRQKTLSFGAYPAVGLKDTCKQRDEAKAQPAAGIDPGAHKAVREALRKSEAQSTR